MVLIIIVMCIFPRLLFTRNSAGHCWRDAWTRMRGSTLKANCQFDAVIISELNWLNGLVTANSKSRGLCFFFLYNQITYWFKCINMTNIKFVPVEYVTWVSINFESSWPSFKPMFNLLQNWVNHHTNAALSLVDTFHIIPWLHYANSGYSYLLNKKQLGISGWISYFNNSGQNKNYFFFFVERIVVIL